MVASASSSSSSTLPSSSSSSSSRVHAQHRIPEESVHMNVLGRDGTDLDITTCNSSSSSSAIVTGNSDHDNKNKNLKSGVHDNNNNDIKSNNDGNNDGNNDDDLNHGDKKMPAVPSSNLKSPPESSTSSSSSSSSSPSPGHSQHNNTISNSKNNKNDIKGTSHRRGVSRKVAPHSTENQATSSPRRIPGSAPSSPTAGTASSDSRGWWGKMVWRRNRSTTEEATNYQSLEAELRLSGQYSPPFAGVASLDAQTTSAAAASRQKNGSTLEDQLTIEDKLRQDCSFFYQGMDDTPQKRNGLRPLTSALDKVPRVLSLREGARFHARYQRLNQDISIAQDDLYLDEEDSMTRPANTEPIVDFSSDCSRNITDVQNSSLFYEQNGRVLMRLPRDQVRLVMDPDLEPGIVSVEQWRPTSSETYNVHHLEITTTTTTTTMKTPQVLYNDNDPLKPAATTNQQQHQQQHQQHPFDVEASGGGGGGGVPPLRYVMTVPDDLYRRVVSDMSHKIFPPCCGLFKCCNNDSERADIKVALIILFVVLVLLFISTMEWPTE